MGPGVLSTSDAPHHGAPATAAAQNAAAQVAATLLALPRPATRPRVLCIDGRSGSGKSTLAHEVAALVPRTHVLAIDLLLDGWDGLDAVAEVLVAQVLRPLSDEGLKNRRIQHRVYDWHRAHFVTPAVVPACDLLVVEGVGSGSEVTAPHRDLLVWTELDSTARKQRALARDGEMFVPHWDAWAAAEERLFEREMTRRRADLVVDTAVAVQAAGGVTPGEAAPATP